MGEIRSGWPMRAEDYPAGYGVADPPGFCFQGCDCMDDQRMQRAWETVKAWLEQPARTQAALGAMNAFAVSGSARRRGEVTKRWYFETPTDAQGDTTHAKAALEIASTIEKAVAVVMKAVPFQSLGTEGEPVRIPVAMTLSALNMDYEPLRFKAKSPLPPWLHLHPDNGELTLEADAPAFITEPLTFEVAFAHAEGDVAKASITITPERRGALSPWAMNATPIAERFSAVRERMESCARMIMLGHLGEVYDISKRVPREVGLGEWLNVMSRLHRMCRTLSTSNVTISETIRRGVAPRV